MLYIITHSRHTDGASVISRCLFLPKLSSADYTGISEKFIERTDFISNDVVLYYINIMPKIKLEHVCRWIAIVIIPEKDCLLRVISMFGFMIILPRF